MLSQNFSNKLPIPEERRCHVIIYRNTAMNLFHEAYGILDCLRKSAISGFSRELDENCTLLGCYAASCGNSLLTFRNNLSVPSSRVENPKRKPVAVLYGLYVMRSSSKGLLKKRLLRPCNRGVSVVKNTYVYRVITLRNDCIFSFLW